MTHPLTPRENLTRPIVGIENRTAHEVFDIMSDRFRAHLTALASGSGDHAELAGKCVRGLQSIEDRICASDPYRFTDDTIYAKSIQAINVLLAKIEALRAERVHLVEQKEGAEDALFNALSRATEAERKLAEAVGLVERSVDLMTDEYADTKAYREEARTFLSKEAERG